MIVGYKPGGTIRDARVVLRPDETLPNRFNVIGTAVYREDKDDNQNWILVKPVDKELPADSPLLSEQSVVERDVKDLTPEPQPATFEHRDIIQFED